MWSCSRSKSLLCGSPLSSVGSAHDPCAEALQRKVCFAWTMNEQCTLQIVAMFSCKKPRLQTLITGEVFAATALRPTGLSSLPVNMAGNLTGTEHNLPDQDVSLKTGYRKEVIYSDSDGDYDSRDRKTWQAGKEDSWSSRGERKSGISNGWKQRVEPECFHFVMFWYSEMRIYFRQNHWLLWKDKQDCGCDLNFLLSLNEVCFTRS